MTLTFKQFITEGVEDKGIFKALFIVGLPGAGKTYTTRVLSGEISPLIINTDKSAEFIAKKIKHKISSETWESMFKDTAHRMTKNMLFNYVNGMLPLFIDGTSNDVSNILQRAGILESLGYDVGCVFVHTSLEKAKERAREREKNQQLRSVDEEFIEKIHRENAENRSFLKSKMKFYIDYHPDQKEFELSDYTLGELYNKVQGFYKGPPKNIVGKRAIQKLREEGEKYLVPTLMTDTELRNKIQHWYRT